MPITRRMKRAQEAMAPQKTEKLKKRESHLKKESGRQINTLKNADLLPLTQGYLHLWEKWHSVNLLSLSSLDKK